MRIQAPNFTQTPNILFDEWLPLLGHAELKVLMVIMRKTFGWHKISDRISLSQLEKMTGLERRHILKASKNLIEKCLISKKVEGPKSSQVTYYELIVIEDSNNFTQCPKDTPPSVLKTPTKETLPKETRSPIVPKGDPLPPRSKIKEEKIQKAPEVWLTERQHAEILRRSSENEKICAQVYDELSKWKMGKGITGGRNDFKACCGWALTEAQKKILENPLEKNKELVEKIRQRYPNHRDIIYGHNYIEFLRGHEVCNIKFSDHGFKEQVLGNLRKMNLDIRDL